MGLADFLPYLHLGPHACFPVLTDLLVISPSDQTFLVCRLLCPWPDLPRPRLLSTRKARQLGLLQSHPLVNWAEFTSEKNCEHLWPQTPVKANASLKIHPKLDIYDFSSLSFLVSFININYWELATLIEWNWRNHATTSQLFQLPINIDREKDNYRLKLISYGPPVPGFSAKKRLSIIHVNINLPQFKDYPTEVKILSRNKHIPDNLISRI